MRTVPGQTSGELANDAAHYEDSVESEAALLSVAVPYESSAVTRLGLDYVAFVSAFGYSLIRLNLLHHGYTISIERIATAEMKATYSAPNACNCG